MSAEQLREVAMIAEAHFLMTFGTDRIDAVREAAAALDARDALIAEARTALEPFAKFAEEVTMEPNWMASPCPLGCRPELPTGTATVGDLRFARATLAKLKAATEQADPKEG